MRNPGYGFGFGSGYGYGDGDGDGDGYGSGSGCEPLPGIGRFTVTVHRAFAVLRVGCAIREADDWIANADAIDAKHGSPGLADQTRALALGLLARKEAT